MRPLVLALLLVAAVTLDAQLPALGNARRGGVVMRERNCLECHRFEGAGAGTAPDLSRHPGRAYTQGELAGLIWNHAPAMYQAMESRKVSVPAMDERDVSDLFAYMYAVRFFDPPGDAARGKAVFEKKRCAVCHDASQQKTGPPLSEWKEAGDPVAWIREMWNHSGTMYARMQQKRIPWPEFSGQELSDLLVYLKSRPETRDTTPGFSPADPQTGASVFEQKGCSGCHAVGPAETGKVTLPGSAGRSGSLVGVAAAMWNHAPLMHRLSATEKRPAPPQLSGTEMNHLIAYLFWAGFFTPGGNPGEGRRVFERKQCGQCHQQPPLAGRASAFAMTRAVWSHGPQMLAEIKKRGRAWPQFEGSEMADLIAFMNQQK